MREARLMLTDGASYWMIRATVPCYGEHINRWCCCFLADRLEGLRARYPGQPARSLPAAPQARVFKRTRQHPFAGLIGTRRIGHDSAPFVCLAWVNSLEISGYDGIFPYAATTPGMSMHSLCTALPRSELVMNFEQTTIGTAWSVGIWCSLRMTFIPSLCEEPIRRSTMNRCGRKATRHPSRDASMVGPGHRCNSTGAPAFEHNSSSSSATASESSNNTIRHGAFLPAQSSPCVDIG